MNLELVTLTEDSAVITWYTGHPGTEDGLGRTEPARSDGEVRWGTHPDRLPRTTRSRGDDTPYHAVGTSDFGLAAGGPYSFTVPKPPPGRFLFSIALCNDLHMSETQAGLVGGIPQFKRREPAPGPTAVSRGDARVHGRGRSRRRCAVPVRRR